MFANTPFKREREGIKIPFTSLKEKVKGLSGIGFVFYCAVINLIALFISY